MSVKSLRRSLSKLKGVIEKKSGGIEWFIKMRMSKYGFPVPYGSPPKINIDPVTAKRIEEHMAKNKEVKNG